MFTTAAQALLKMNCYKQENIMRAIKIFVEKNGMYLKYVGKYCNTNGFIRYLERIIPALFTTTCWSIRTNPNKTKEEIDDISSF